MGYDTSYDLCMSYYPSLVEDGDRIVPDLIKQGIYKRLNEIAGDADHELIDDAGYVNDLRWYDHTEDLTQLSTEFPAILFELYGNGESSDDVWVEFYLGGKHYWQSRIVDPEFDPKELEAENENKES